MDFGSNYVELGATAIYERHKDTGDPYEKTFEYLFGESNETGEVSVVSANVNANLVNKYSGKDEPYIVTYQVRDDLGNVKETDLKVYNLLSLIKLQQKTFYNQKNKQNENRSMRLL